MVVVYDAVTGEFETREMHPGYDFRCGQARNEKQRTAVGLMVRVREPHLVERRTSMPTDLTTLDIDAFLKQQDG